MNTCVASASRLDWLPPNSFDAAITFGAFSMLRSRARLCSSYRAVLHTLRPGGRFVIADVEHPDRCSRPSSSSGPSSSSLAEAASLNSQPDECASCHWRVSVPLAFWIACTPMDLEVTVSTVEHTDLPGTSTYPCASRHFALLAQRASTPHEVRATIEASSEESKASKVAVLLSLSASDTVDGEFQQRVQYLKEASIDNKRMYCGLHGYSLVIGEELHHARDRWASRLPCGLPWIATDCLPMASRWPPFSHELYPRRGRGWDKVKLLAAQHANYEWLLWVPLDAIFADTASSLDALTDDKRANIIALQDESGDGMGTGVLSEPLLIRGKTEWSRRLLEQVR